MLRKLRALDKNHINFVFVHENQIKFVLEPDVLLTRDIVCNQNIALNLACFATNKII